MLDMFGNVTEFANSNAFMAKDGIVYTPTPNGTFLDGVAHRRVIGLLRATASASSKVGLPMSDFQSADEIFSTGNFQKVAPMTRINNRCSRVLYKKARALYWEFAHDATRQPTRLPRMSS